MLSNDSHASLLQCGRLDDAAKKHRGGRLEESLPQDLGRTGVDGWSLQMTDRSRKNRQDKKKLVNDVAPTPQGSKKC